MTRSYLASTAVALSAALVLASPAAAQSPTANASRAATAPRTNAPALDDATIVAIFDAANTADIETGELAVKRGQSKEVRDFGAMLIRDHTNVRQQGRDLAKKLGVTPTPPADDAGAKAHAEAMKMLQTKKGAAFDHAFLQHEVAFHKSVIDAVTSTLLPAIKNAEVKDLVVKVAPAFQAHMMAAQSLDDRLSGKSGK